MSQHPGRRATDQTPSGGMIYAADAAQILGVSPNRFRQLVEEGALEPAHTFRNGPKTASVYYRWQVQSLRDRRQAFAHLSDRARVVTGLRQPNPGEQRQLPGSLRRDEW